MLDQISMANAVAETPATWPAQWSTQWPACSTGTSVQGQWVSNTGLVRAHNEDACLIDEALGLYVLADGMGGYNAGEVASRLAVDHIRQYLHDHLMFNETPEQKQRLLADAVAHANESILRTAKKRPECLGMGTTVVVALVDKRAQIAGSLETMGVTIAHVGDSRAYLYSASAQRLSQLTKDHSLGQELADRGAMKGAELARYAMRGVLTRAMGAQEHSEATTASFGFSKDDLLIICSDGLSDMLADAEIQTQINKCKAEGVDLTSMSHQLVAHALARGGNDNVSVMIVQMAEV
jgi:PPM family protein phosphatase